MNDAMIRGLLGLIMLTINGTATFLMFPRKRSLHFTIGVLVAVAAIYFIAAGLTGFLNAGLIVREWSGVVFLPVVVCLFKGTVFQKIFGFFQNYLLTFLQFSFAEEASRIFFFNGSKAYYLLWVVLTLVLYTSYIFLMFRYGRRLFERLFAYGRQSEWAVYSFGALFSFTIFTVYRIDPGNPWKFISLLFFFLWSFGVLCFAIINTHEKSKQRYDAEFARNIISSGREHYQQMDEMRDTLRILRHDYKYHLNTIRELLLSGNTGEADKYLTEVDRQLSEKELPGFCKNSVINALLAGYAERCMELDIKFDTLINLPEVVSVPNYELCIILGNLLENAVEACQKRERSRKINLTVKPQGAQLAVMVKNSFDGVVIQDEGQPVSAKRDGGLGLRSVQAVAAQYGGELVMDWDKEMFTAYVLVSL